jgi:hypothetical protein
MKKLLTFGLIASLLLPGIAFAAYNDVTLGSSAKVTAAGRTLDVEGDSNVIETIGVEADFITFTLKTNSFLVLTSPTYHQIEWSATSTRYVTSSSCESNLSRVRFASTDAEVAITVFPKNVSCPVGSATTGGSSGGGGGGGGSTATATVVAAPMVSSTKEAQIASIMQAIAALQSQIQALTGAPAAQVSAISGKITGTLSTGSRGPSVKTLQQFLNSQGFKVASTGPGSPGNETETFGNLTVQAVRKFQEQYGIASQGVPGYGTVGPKTRAKIAELSGN